MQPPNDDARAEAQRRCRLSDEEVRMAKELGFKPKSLIKNIPAPSQKWKAPVREWVRALYEKKIGSRALAGGAPAPPAARKQVIEFRNPDYPWPDKPDIPERVMVDPFDEDEDDDDIFGNKWEPPSDADIDDQNILLLRRQCLYRWAGQLIAIAMNELPEVQKVAAFGAVAQPLEMEVPRFREFRRHRIEILHECADLDLAVWTTDLSRLKALKSAMQRGISLVQDTPWGGVAHHQVDVHLFDAESGAYRGRQCIFGQCPKPGKRECLAEGVERSRSCSSLKNTGSMPRNSKASRKSFCSTGPANFWFARRDSTPSRPGSCIASGKTMTSTKASPTTTCRCNLIMVRVCRGRAHYIA
jgi:hypothetical protein